MPSTLGEDLRAFFLADGPISSAVGGARIHQNMAPEQYAGRYLWFGRAGTQPEDAHDDAVGERPFRELFDLEAISEDLDEAEALADLLRGKDKYRGALGSGTVQALRITDQDDDYLPRGDDSDEGRHVAALELQVIGYVPGA